jgi:alpha-galactosidase
VKRLRTSRRRFLQLAAGAGVASSSIFLGNRAQALDARGTDAATIGDGRILIEFDPQMRSRVWHLPPVAGRNRVGGRDRAIALTDWAAAEVLTLGDGSAVSQFALREHTLHKDGRSTLLRLVGVSESLMEKTVEIDLSERYPGIAIYKVSYRNLSPQPTAIHRWTNSSVRLLAIDPKGPSFWSYCGSTHSDRRDWVQPVGPGFAQDNFMGMEASDYGSGTPIVDVWRKDCGLAVGHLSSTAQPVSLPVTYADGGVHLGIGAESKQVLQPGERLDTLETFVATHTGDYFTVLNSYRRIMDERGLKSPRPPAAAYEPIWCAWGYERDCTTQLIVDTLPKVRDLGLRWAVIDDGWQSNVGDWNLNPAKYPRGEADMQQLVQSIRRQGLKPRLWFAPLAAAPGSDLLHDHTDMLLLDKEGAVQNISWWNCFYLCPAYEKTIAYTQNLVRKFLGEWGYAGLKIDGQHLNGVAPCFSPAHRHASPYESAQKLQDFFAVIYETAMQVNPDAVVELCPCGTSYSFFNFHSLNQAPASDPESSWQVRHKGKTLKALMGPSAAFAGDHVELSDGGDDFASTVGIGGIISTKFTWPRDPKPKDSFLLTAEREQVWRKWIALYNERLLPQGTYRGELYDIGFDKPETHVVEKSGHLYYAFYSKNFAGPVELRGLAAKRYRVRDYFNDRALGEVSRSRNQVAVTFDGFLLLEAIPV